MQFTLYYRGPLRSGDDRQQKHLLRQHFHKQMKRLWSEPPLVDSSLLYGNPPGSFKQTRNAVHNLSVIRDLHGYKFAPLICDTLHLLAELDIQMLWSQKPGAIFSEGGDIDNRLKTLFDALKIPKERGELPDGATPAADEIPFFSLVDDDRLISRVTVETDRLLDDVASRSEVALLIRVRTRTVKTVLGTLGLF